MFRNRLLTTQYKELFRNIYKFKKDLLLGVAELIEQILFFTLQLPLSSLYTTGILLTRQIKKHTMVF